MLYVRSSVSEWSAVSVQTHRWITTHMQTALTATKCIRKCPLRMERSKKKLRKKANVLKTKQIMSTQKDTWKGEWQKKSSLQLIRRIYMVGIRHMFHLKKYLCIVYKCSLSIRNASYVIQILLSHFIEQCSIKRHSTS